MNKERFYFPEEERKKLIEKYPVCKNLLDKEIHKWSKKFNENHSYAEMVEHKVHLPEVKEILYYEDRERKEEMQTKEDYVIHIQDLLREPIKKANPIIKNLIPEKSIIGIFGEPGSCKSLVADHLGCAVSTGSSFLGEYKVKKQPVLLLPTENHRDLEKIRVRSIFREMKINPTKRKKNKILFSMWERKFISTLNNVVFYSKLEDTISKKKIKLLIIDTISPLISDQDDNRANSVVEIFNERLFPLVDKFGLTIIFLMHSQKSGRDFLGSIKFKASCDVFYEMLRNEKKPEELSLLCHKGRMGETNVKMKISFENRNDLPYRTGFEFIETFSGKQSIKNKDNNPTKIKECQDLILKELDANELQYKGIINVCEETGYSLSTIKRAINLLYEDKKILKKRGKTGGYYVS